MDKYHFDLYVTGQNARSQHAIHSFRAICDSVMPERYELKIIDVLEQPQAAEDNKIIATPTLVKTWPLPLRRIVGDLSQREKLMILLDLYSSTTGT